MQTSPREDIDLIDRPSLEGANAPTSFLESRPGVAEQPIAPIVNSRIIFALPAFNEEQTLPPLLERIQMEMAKHSADYKVIVVDDGSTDGTANVVDQASIQMPVKLEPHKQNQGLGAAIRTGLRAAACEARPDDIIVTMDADNTQPPELVHQMARQIGNGYDIVVASRYQKGGKVTGLAAHRHLLSYGARWMFSMAFPIRGLRDFTSGFRAYRASLIQEAFDRFGNDLVTEPGFACMTDLMIKLRRLKPRVCEVAMVLSYGNKVGASKMRVVKTILDSFKLIAKRRVGIMK